ncbi:hypothetical protein Q672_10785 [Marinobacter sp. EVN1]|uniref:hypothetical protein n=1 Tax=Marinobacter sp. EVN1 TaxID=1397532 RepID=UPI0003B86F59|nr:hypothetical protein [Marinobacter sp. EVN1]ERS88334.1 hypothetical protein Q672_10785 [Marinobacter sp. EVN1]
MTADVQPFRRPKPGAFAKRQMFRDWILYGVIALLLLSVFGLMALAVSLKQQAEDDTIYRSQAEMVNGGKRFIDAFYSLNAATIEHDQFKAISMMATRELQDERLDYLTRTDLVRKVRSSGIASVIRWDHSKTKVIKREGRVYTIEYSARLVLNQKNAHPLNIVLELVPVEKSDDNTDGVGVLSWVDVAGTPFAEGVTE